MIIVDESRRDKTVVLSLFLNLIRIHHEPRQDIASIERQETYYNGYSNNDVGDRHSVCIQSTALAKLNL